MYLSRLLPVTFAFVVTGLTLAAADAWIKKKPMAWSVEDIQTVLGKSAWARQANVEFEVPGLSGGPRGETPATPPPVNTGLVGGDATRNGTMGPLGQMAGTPRSPKAGDLPQFHAVVRWETALPVRLASRFPVEAKPNQYVISITGFPLLRAKDNPDTAANLEELKAAARITRKDKAALRASRLETRESGNGLVLYYTFPVAPADVIVADDREVFFSTGLGQLHLRIRFPLKDMMYQGKLEL